MKYRSIIGLLAVLLLVVAVPVFAAQAKPTLSSLAQQFQKLAAKVKYMTSKGTLPAKYVTYVSGTTGLGTTNLQMAVTTLADKVTVQKQADNIVYANSASGLAAVTLQDAVDEIGIGLPELLLKKGEVAEGTRPTTTWKGHRYSYGTKTDPALESAEITLTFTPTDASRGTFTSSPLYAFDVNGSSNGCGKDGTFNGNYEIVENMLFAYVTGSAANPNCESSIVATSSFSVQGKTVHFVNNRTIPNDINIYTRQ